MLGNKTPAYPKNHQKNNDYAQWNAHRTSIITQ